MLALCVGLVVMAGVVFGQEQDLPLTKVPPIETHRAYRILTPEQFQAMLASVKIRMVEGRQYSEIKRFAAIRRKDGSYLFQIEMDPVSDPQVTPTPTPEGAEAAGVDAKSLRPK